MYFAQSTGLSLAVGQLDRKLDREGVPMVGSAAPGYRDLVTLVISGNLKEQPFCFS